ncbi:sigma-70 family RNA polymerase sigma factor [Empedobacter sp.]|uniref:RNA polymerase sigma factor n=1 Tax=Empedobacter sp. TaxID=1927715 RepID=UPI0028ACE6B2|nr:sigma-70 family RNA polymerase sigma factor [Empedobacter sp.]
MKLFVLNRKSKEEILVDRLKKNDALAQKELYEQNSKKMLSVCRSYIEDMHYAEDCMINGFCKVFNHIEKFQNKGSFEGWMRRIMVNECLTFLRANKTLIYVDDVRVSNYDEADEEVEETWLNFNVQDVLDQLSEHYRLVFNLHILEDYSHQEIAEMLNISVSTSKTQLFRAKAKLKEIVLSKKKMTNEKQR